MPLLVPVGRGATAAQQPVRPQTHPDPNYEKFMLEARNHREAVKASLRKSEREKRLTKIQALEDKAAAVYDEAFVTRTQNELDRLLAFRDNIDLALQYVSHEADVTEAPDFDTSTPHPRLIENSQFTQRVVDACRQRAAARAARSANGDSTSLAVAIATGTARPMTPTPMTLPPIGPSPSDATMGLFGGPAAAHPSASATRPSSTGSVRAGGSAPRATAAGGSATGAAPREDTISSGSSNNVGGSGLTGGSPGGTRVDGSVTGRPPSGTGTHLSSTALANQGDNAAPMRRRGSMLPADSLFPSLQSNPGTEAKAATPPVPHRNRIGSSTGAPSHDADGSSSGSGGGQRVGTAGAQPGRDGAVDGSAVASDVSGTHPASDASPSGSVSAHGTALSARADPAAATAPRDGASLEGAPGADATARVDTDAAGGPDAYGDGADAVGGAADGDGAHDGDASGAAPSPDAPPADPTASPAGADGAAGGGGERNEAGGASDEHDGAAGNEAPNDDGGDAGPSVGVEGDGGAVGEDDDGAGAAAGHEADGEGAGVDGVAVGDAEDQGDQAEAAADTAADAAGDVAGGAAGGVDGGAGDNQGSPPGTDGGAVAPAASADAAADGTGEPPGNGPERVAPGGVSAGGTAVNSGRGSVVRRHSETTGALGGVGSVFDGLATAFEGTVGYDIDGEGMGQPVTMEGDLDVREIDGGEDDLEMAVAADDDGDDDGADEDGLEDEGEQEE